MKPVKSRLRPCPLRGHRIAGGLVLLLAGCQSLPSAAPSRAAASPGTPPPASASSPVLGFVSRAMPGEASIVEDPAYGRTRVTILREYFSADGIICRRFALTPAAAIAQEPQTRIACRENGGWRLSAIVAGGETASGH